MKKVRESTRTYKFSAAVFDDVLGKLLAEKRKNQNCNFHLDKEGIILKGSIRFRDGDSPRSYDLGLIFRGHESISPRLYLKTYNPRKYEPNKKILGTNPHYFKLLSEYIQLPL